MAPKVLKAKEIVKQAAGTTGASINPGRASRTPQQRRPHKPLGDLYTRIAEKSNVPVSSVRQVYEATVDDYI